MIVMIWVFCSWVRFFLVSSSVLSSTVAAVLASASAIAFAFVFSLVSSLKVMPAALLISDIASAMLLVFALLPQPVRTDSARTPTRATARNFFAIFMIFASIIMNDLTGRLSSSGRLPVGLIVPPPPRFVNIFLHFYHIAEL